MDNPTRFCLSVIVPSFFLLSCVSGKQIHYILPILPLVALLLSHIATTTTEHSLWNRTPLIILFLLLSIALVIVPRLPLHGGDREMIKYIPQWIAIIPVLCSFFLLLFQAQAVVQNIKIISSTIIMFFLFFHLAIAKPLHKIYNQTVVGNAIRNAQEQGTRVAIFPAKMADQFQFAGRLQSPLFPQKSVEDFKKWTIAHPHSFQVIFTEIKPNTPLKPDTNMRLYSNGWLFWRTPPGLNR